MKAHEPIDTYSNGSPTNLSSILFSAAEALQIRSEVTSTVSSIVDDIEATHQLQQEVNHHHALRLLEAKTAQAENALKEYKVTFDTFNRQRLELADSFALQLWKLALALDAFEQIKREYEEKTKAYDNILQLWNNRSTNVDENEHIVHIFRSAILNQDMDDYDAHLSDGQSDQQSNIDDRDIEAIAASNNTVVEHKVQDNQSSAETSIDALPIQLSADTVSDETNRDHVDINLLETLPERVLMRIFNFMTAYDILNFAQTSVSNYSKVDRLFGLGDDETQLDLSSTNRNMNELSLTPEILSESTHLQAAPFTQPENCNVTTPQINHIETLDRTDESANSLHSPELIHGNATPNSKAPESKGIRAGPLSHVLTLLPNVDKNSLGGLIKSKLSGMKIDHELSDPLSPVKNSLVSKLTPTELSAIISLRDERQKSISEIHHLLAENNNLRLKLDGFEPMKTFLLEKISTLEGSLQQKNDEMRLITDEVKSDQEVIAFLDLRVNELEKKCQTLEEERTRAIETVDLVKKATQKQLTVMEDMLKFERDNLVENEKEWKATKKLLVKEIKNSRAQILTLRAERDACSEQIAKYRDALLQLSK